MTSGGLQLDIGQSTDPGLDPHKRVNEDACGNALTKFGHLFVVCDGMGGHAGGKEASDIAIRTIFDEMVTASEALSPRQALVAAIEEAARRVYRIGGPPDNHQRPGSTCVAILLHGGRVEVAHVGDSRAYAIRGKQIFALTRDHSMVQDMVDNGLLSEQEAIGHPDSNKITRALGMTPEVEVEAREEPLELYDGDVFVLSSDGLTDLARKNDILVTVLAYLERAEAQTAANELVALANRRGGHDNITVQVVRVTSVGPKASRTRVQEPGLDTPAVGPVSTTIRGEPAPTMVQEPAGRTDPGAPEYFGPDAMPPSVPGLATTEPGRPAVPLHEALLDAGLRPAPRIYHDPSYRGRDPRLLYLVFALLGVIGLLAALLTWSLFFR